MVALLLLAGCTGGSQMAGGGDGANLGAQSGGGEGGGVPAATGGGGAAADDLPSVQQRAVIKNGRVAVVVDSFEETNRNLTRAVERYGGYVADTEQRVSTRNNRSYTDGELVLRVPSDNFSRLMEDAKAEGRLEYVRTNTTDVTDQLVDLEARLSNLRAERERLRTLYEEAEDTEDVLAVGERLSEVQGEIERLEARKQSLEDRVAFSTIRVDIEERRPDRIIDTEEWYDVGLLAAFLDSVNGAWVTLRALSVLFAYALPYLVVFGVPFVGAVLGLRRLRRRRGKPLVPRPGLLGSDDEEEGEEQGSEDAGDADEGDESDAPDDEDGVDGESADVDDSAADEAGDGDGTADGDDASDDGEEASEDASGDAEEATDGDDADREPDAGAGETDDERSA